MLSPHPSPSENWCYRTAVLSVANSDDKQGRFDSSEFSSRFRKGAAVGTAASSRPQKSTRFSEGFASTNGAIGPLWYPLSIASTFPTGVVSTGCYRTAGVFRKYD